MAILGTTLDVRGLGLVNVAGKSLLGPSRSPWIWDLRPRKLPEDSFLLDSSDVQAARVGSHRHEGMRPK